MARTFTPKIVSANDLFDGDVIYLGHGGAWTRHLAEAQVATSEEAADALMAKAAGDSLVIGPTLVDVRRQDGTPRPTHFREIFRDRGPSNRPDLGRQADAALHASPAEGGV